MNKNYQIKNDKTHIQSGKKTSIKPPSSQLVLSKIKSGTIFVQNPRLPIFSNSREFFVQNLKNQFDQVNFQSYFKNNIVQSLKLGQHNPFSLNKNIENIESVHTEKILKSGSTQILRRSDLKALRNNYINIGITFPVKQQNKIINNQIDDRLMKLWNYSKNPKNNQEGNYYQNLIKMPQPSKIENLNLDKKENLMGVSPKLHKKKNLKININLVSNFEVMIEERKSRQK